jgi:hypothetical protein
LLILKFSQRGAWVELSLIATRQMVPTLIVKAKHTSGIYHNPKRLADC